MGSAPTYTESSPVQNRPTMAMNASRSWPGRADLAPRVAVETGAAAECDLATLGKYRVRVWL
ncbi:hypothetical protein STAFG_0079 [Streptomyces afghaniensis 772]|uniref:Uncharacterized protein n=1 Tax=Streptomyces afghaniensis 772 TaxID=1283301 RepID=S4N1X3_9ACTN|nr:hypothetical protein STAFG_0079 [Streptomyces afghaniensis 772]